MAQLGVHYLTTPQGGITSSVGLSFLQSNLTPLKILFIFFSACNSMLIYQISIITKLIECILLDCR